MPVQWTPDQVIAGPRLRRMLCNMFGISTCLVPKPKYSKRDCLNIAIYVPNIRASEGLPMTVYLYGGRLRQDGNAHPAHG
ncbi:MAG: hypothetical protein BYD32DRAFT_458677 [Podila humilis]|nr:MAG: hypothetical protein BYD32DRAFT_458677 [Podila humilis]